MILAFHAMRMLLLLSLVPAAAFAQDQGSRSLGPTLLAVGKAVDEARARKLPAALELDRFQSQLLTLEQELNKRRSVVPEDYQTTFNAYRLVILATLADLEAPTAAPSVAALTADLEIKNRYLASTAGFFETREPPLVTVTVLTARVGVPAPGFRVSFHSAGNAPGRPPTHPVSSDTNNAVRKLPPGRYTLQLYLADAPVASREVDIGSVNSKEETISIDVSKIAN